MGRSDEGVGAFEVYRMVPPGDCHYIFLVDGVPHTSEGQSVVDAASVPSLSPTFPEHLVRGLVVPLLSLPGASTSGIPSLTILAGPTGGQTEQVPRAPGHTGERGGADSDPTARARSSIAGAPSCEGGMEL